MFFFFISFHISMFEYIIQNMFHAVVASICCQTAPLVLMLLFAKDIAQEAWGLV